MPQYAALRLGWYETASFNVVLLQGLALIFVSVIPVALVRFVRSLRQSGDRRAAPRGARAAYWLILGIAVLNLVYTAGTFLWVMQPSELHSPLLIYKIVLGLGVLSTVLTVGALVYAVLSWRNGYWGIASRVYYTLATVAAVAFVWFLNYWNMLGWRY
jgi:hypothetical protein